jgi:hypothetical protein
MKLIFKLKNAYHWVFRTKHIKNLLIAIDQHELEVLEHSQSSNEGIYIQMVMSTLKSEVQMYIYQRASIIDEIFNGLSESAYHVAARIMIKFCENKITSGRHHIYRGTLSSEGRAYFFILVKLNNDLIELGDYSEEDGDEYLGEISSQIKSVG